MSNNSVAMQRISALVDENSFVEIGAGVTARSTDFDLKNENTPSDGVVTGHGLIDGNLVYVYAQDPEVLGGSIGEMHARKISSIYDLALKTGAPVIGLIDSTGMRIQESVDALEAIASIYAKQTSASGVIPQVSVVYGQCGGGMSVMASLSDFTFAIADSAKIFVNSPDSIKENNSTKCDSSAPSWQMTDAGTVDFCGSADDVVCSVRNLISILPSNNAQGVINDGATDDMNRGCNSLDTMRADSRYLIAEIADNNMVFESKADFAPEMVTAIIKLGGITVGCVANATAKYENGEKVCDYEARIKANAANKAADFVNLCDSFDIPVISFTNAEGFSACCLCNEKKLAKALARMTYAFSNATVGKINFITGKAYSSVYAMMNAKSLGADLVYAYPDVKLGMMDSKLAAMAMYPNASADELNEKANEYAKLQGDVSAAARRGYIDAVIDFADTRKYLIDAVQLLETKSIEQPYKKHGTK